MILYNRGRTNSVFHFMIQSRTLIVRLIVTALFLTMWTGVFPLAAQQTEFIPRSKHEIAEDLRAAAAERKKIASSGIYAMTKTKFYYRFGKVDKIGVMEEAVRFDTRGNIIKETLFNPSDGSIVSTTSYRYDKNGNRIEQQMKKGETVLKTVHRFDSRGNNVETVYYKADGSVDRKVTHVYDENGLLLETFGRMDDGRLFMRDTYLYDARSNVSEFKNSLKKFVMTYDPRGNIHTVEKYQRYFKQQDSIQYNLTDKVSFTYDASGKSTEMLVYRPDHSLKSRTQYVRNNAGQLLEEKEFNAEGKLVYTRTIKYDAGNNVIEESGADRALKFKNTYRYDNKGLKTEWITYDQINEPVSVTKYSYSKGGNIPPQPGQTAGAADSLFASDDDEPLNNEEFFNALGSRIIAPDGTYLGMVLADTANPQSIINSWGQYGFSQSPTSILNPSIPYGGDNGIFSPFNPLSPSPPSIYKDGKFFSYLTDNDSFRPRSAPRKLLEFLRTLARQN